MIGQIKEIKKTKIVKKDDIKRKKIGKRKENSVYISCKIKLKVSSLYEGYGYLKEQKNIFL